MTLVESQRNKMNAIVSDFVSKEMVPALYKLMKEKKLEMCPYVELIGETPATGIKGFWKHLGFLRVIHHFLIASVLLRKLTCGKLITIEFGPLMNFFFR